MGEVTRPRGNPRSPPLTIWGSIVTPRAAAADAPSTRRHPELDGYRGLAILGIVVYHVYQYCNVSHYLYGGTAGYTILNSLDAMVPFFFVIGAYVIFEPIARGVLEGLHVISPRTLLLRRALRLLPVYVVAIGVVWFLRQRSLPGDWRDLVEHLTFTQIFDSKRIFYTIGPAWSLSVAMYFYLLVAAFTAVMAHVCRRMPDRKSRAWLMAGLIAAVALVSLAWITWSYGVRHRPTDGSFTTWFGPLANMGDFAVGMGIALLVALQRERRPLGRAGTAGLRVAAGVLLFVGFETRQIDTWPAAFFGTICSVAFGCLVAATTLGVEGDAWSRSASWWPFRWLGAISLSIYLWHEPIMLAVGGSRGFVHQRPGSFGRDVIIVLGASIAIGWLSYVLIERPTTRLARALRRQSSFLRTRADDGDGPAVIDLRPGSRRTS